MDVWWQGLTLLTKVFAVAALFCTVLFLWQMISMLIGVDVDGHADVADGGMDHVDVSGAPDGTPADHVDGSTDHGHHGLEGQVGFSLVSVRSVIAFATLFTWAGTLYLMSGVSTFLAMIYSLIWGGVAMFAVSYLVYKLVQLQETGNVSLWSSIGEEGSVYMNIPVGGVGKVRVLVGNVLSCVNARTPEQDLLVEGTKVRVTRVLDDNTIEVVPLRNQKEA